MFKKLDRYLLTHHPFVWSTRIHWVVTIIVPIWALLFLLGFIADAPNEGGEEAYAEWFFLMSILSLVALIFWLILVGRHNLAKQFGIRPRFDGWLEFLLYFVCIGVIVSLSMSFPMGQTVRAKLSNKEGALKEKVMLINQADAWIFPDCSKFRYRSARPAEEMPPGVDIAAPVPDTTVEMTQEAIVEETPTQNNYDYAVQLCEPDTLRMADIEPMSYPFGWATSSRDDYYEVDEFKRDVTMESQYARMLTDEAYRRATIEGALEVMTEWKIVHGLTYESIMSRYDARNGFSFNSTRYKKETSDYESLRSQISSETYDRINRVRYSKLSFSKELWRGVFYITFYLTIFFSIFRNMPRRPFIWGLVSLVVLPIIYGIFVGISNGGEDTFYALSCFTLLAAVGLVISLYMGSRRNAIQLIGLLLLLVMLPHFPLFTFEILDLRPTYEYQGPGYEVYDQHYYAYLRKLRFYSEWGSLLVFFLLWQPVFKPLLIRANSLPEA